MKTEEFLNYNVSAVCGTREVKGDKFGVELELEGRNVALADVATRGWNRHQDGSLRGESVEYTTAGGKDHEETKKLVVELFDKFDKHKVKIKDSIRTSTHVHLNFSDRPFKQALNFFCLFTVLEEVLQYYSGEDRKGNVFCISSREAEGIIGILLDGVRKCSLMNFAGDRYKYSACNLSTLFKFGTIEVRTMKGAVSAEQINKWLDIINDLYEYACQTMKSPVELVTDLSVLGAERFMRKIFKPESYEELMKNFPAIQTLQYSLMEGARLIQLFAYEFEEDFNAVVEIAKPVAEKKIKDKKLDHVEGVDAPPGQGWSIYRPDGVRWGCFSIHGDAFRHGDHLEDCPTIFWSELEGRFKFVKPNGDLVICRWAEHPIHGDEGPPAMRERIPRHIVERVEMEDADDDEDIEFDEGDDF
jgi:hypothetical protein